MSLSGGSYSRAEALHDLLELGDLQRSRDRGGSGDAPQIREDDHVEADQILLGLIDDDEIRAAFDRIEKWYA